MKTNVHHSLWLVLCISCSRPITVASNVPPSDPQGTPSPTNEFQIPVQPTGTMTSSPPLVPPGTQASLQWQSQNSTACLVIQRSTGAVIAQGTTGSTLTPALNANDSFALVCANGTTVTVSMAPITTVALNVGTGCGGELVGGGCWYLGAINLSCTAACVSHGGYNTLTRDYTGDRGTDAKCQSVAGALGIKQVVTDYNGNPYNGVSYYGLGCGLNLGVLYRVTDPTTAESAALGVQRFCACNQ